VLLKIVYLLVRQVLGFAVLVAFRRDLTKDAELLALRHENAVLCCGAGQADTGTSRPTGCGSPRWRS